MVFLASDNRAEIEQQIVSEATEIALESLNNIEHGGLDVIKDAVTTGTETANTDFVYTDIWNKVYRHVLVRLENERKLAHILMI